MTNPRLASLLCLLLVLAACGGGNGGGGHKEAEGGHGAHGEEAGAHEEGGGVELSREQIVTAGIKLGRVKIEASGGFVRGTGEIQADPDRTVQLGSAVAGRVTMARGAIGDPVRAGQVLATVVSVEQTAASAELRSAEARLALAEEDLKRERSLFERGLSPRRDLLAAEAGERSARADLEGARLRTGAMSSSIASPISGQIAMRGVTVGQVVDPGEPLYVVVSSEDIQAIVDLYDRDLARVKVGATATLFSRGSEGVTASGRVVAIGPVIDETTRTGKVRVLLKDGGARLRPGTFVSASIRVDGRDHSDSGEVMLLPADAVARLGDRRVVFVANDDPHGYRFEPRDVETGFRDADLIEIRGGVTKDDRIAVEGVFSVLSALRSGELGEGHAH